MVSSDIHADGNVTVIPRYSVLSSYSFVVGVAACLEKLENWK